MADFPDFRFYIPNVEVTYAPVVQGVRPPAMPLPPSPLSPVGIAPGLQPVGVTPQVEYRPGASLPETSPVPRFQDLVIELPPGTLVPEVPPQEDFLPDLTLDFDLPNLPDVQPLPAPDADPCPPNPAETPAGLSPLDIVTNVYPSVRLNTVTLENATPDMGGSEYFLTYNMDFSEIINDRGSVRWYDDLNYTQFLRLRVITCWGQDNNVSTALDFVSQRLNQFQKNLQYKGKEDYKNWNKGDYYAKVVEIINQNFPTENNDMGEILADEVFDCYTLTKEYFKAGRGMNLGTTMKTKSFPNTSPLRNVVVADAPIGTLMTTDENGLPVRRLTRTTRNVATLDEEGQYDYTRGQLEVETVPLNPVVTKVSIPVSQRLPINIDGINIGLLASNMTHLSQYAFVYLDYDLFLEQTGITQDGDIPPLQSGMGFINVSTEIGNYVEYEPQPYFSDTVFGVAVQNSVLHPQIAKFHDLRLYSTLSVDRLDVSIYDGVFDNLAGSLVDTDSLRVVERDNFFSDFWVSKDDNEDARYIFSFDKLALLISESRFPGLYMNPETATSLLHGGSLLDIEDTAKVLDIKMKKKRLDYTSTCANNNLGTYIRLREKEVTQENPVEILDTPHVVQGLYIQGSSGGRNNLDNNVSMSFYEGTDKYTQERNTRSLIRYQYGCEVFVNDPSLLYLKNTVKFLREYATKVKEIENHITSSPPLPNGSEIATVTLGVPGGPEIQANLDGYGLYDYHTNMMTLRSPFIYMNAYNLPANEILEATITAYIETLKNLSISLGNRPGTLEQWTYDDLETSLRTVVNNTLDPAGVLLIHRLITHLAFRLDQIIGRQIKLVDAENGYIPHSVMEQRGFCQRKYIIHQHEHFFDTPFEFGREYKIGYSYLDALKQDRQDTEITGIKRISRTQYELRVMDEYDKYFATENLPTTPDDIPPQFRPSAYQYFSPLQVHTFDKDPVTQTTYRDERVPLCKYDIDRYGELLSDIFKVKNHTEYLDRPFYSIIDPGSKNNTPNVLLYKSLNQGLRTHYCNITKGSKELFGVPFPSFDFQYMPPTLLNNIPRLEYNPSSYEIYTKTTQSTLLPFVIGGTSQTTTETTTEQDFSDKLREIDNKDQPGNTDITFKEPEKSDGEPIKVTFGLLGEMEIDPNFSNTSYEKRDFNSLTLDANRMGLMPVENFDTNVRTIQDNMINLPNQLRAMYALASITQPRSFLGGRASVVRLLLEDNDEDIQSVSALIEGQQFPPFSSIKDPMKVYAKFLTFWLNYKQLITVEYLTSFDNIDGFGPGLDPENQSRANFYKHKRKLDIWQKLTEDAFLKSRDNKILCRIRPIGYNDFPDINTQDIDLLDLPIYNKYFILELGPPAQRFTTLPPQIPTVEGVPTPITPDEGGGSSPRLQPGAYTPLPQDISAQPQPMIGFVHSGQAPAGVQPATSPMLANYVLPSPMIFNPRGGY